MKRIAALLLCLVPAIVAQTTGELRGTVQDASQKAVVNAKVMLRAQGSGAVRTTQTDDAGAFAFSAAPVGGYVVEVESDGFKSFAQPDVNVRLGHVVTVAVTLEAGTSGQVLATDTPVVERTSTQIGAVVGSRLIENLPLNARDTYYLLQLQPGVVAQQGYDLFAGSENAGVVSVNGGRGRANNFNVNGGDANDQFLATPAIQPAPDSIEEFRVLTNLFDAEQGRNSGSVVNVVTRNGSSQFHGSAFEFFRNRALNTRGFFDTEKPKFNQNQFGGVLGGPILKDRTFFFLSMEARKIRQGISSDVVNVPTGQERAGDFSSGAAFAGSLTDSYVAGALNRRPGCAAAAAAAGGAPIVEGTDWAAIFPGNQIPMACFDRTAADLLNQFVPLPNAGASDFQSVPVKAVNALQPTLRLDHITGAHQLTFYYFMDHGSTSQPFATFQGYGSNLPGFGSSYRLRRQQFNLGDTWSGGATVNEARFVFFRQGESNYNHPLRTHLTRNSCSSVPSSECFSDPQNPGLGITPGLGAGREGVPFVQVSGGFSFGNNSAGELPQVGNSFQFSDNLSRTFGSHRAKFGFDLRRRRFDQTLYYNVNGSYTFSDGGPNSIGGGNLFPDYLLGLPTGYSQGSAQAERVRSTSLHVYAQDSWSVTRNTTLNFGLRWELNTPLADVGRRVQTFRPGQASSIFPCRLAPENPLVEVFGTAECGPGTAGEAVFPFGLVVPGDKGVPTAMTSTDLRAFAPRIGIAWSPSAASGWRARILGGPGKTSIRAGWGVFYNPVEQLVLEQFTSQPPFGGSISLSNRMFNTPFVGQDGSVTANSFNGVLDPKPGQPVDWSAFRPIALFGSYDPRMRTQYAVSYNFTIQRELRRNLLLQVAYIGSQGHRLLASRDLNYGLAQPCLDLNALSSITGDSSLACGPFSADSAYTIGANQIPEGFKLHLPYGPAASITGPNPNPVTLVGLRRYSSPSCNPLTGAGCPPDGTPVFGSIIGEDAIANSNYNSLQIGLEKRAFAGLEFQAAYTYGKSIDNASSFEDLLNPLDYRATRSLSLFDARSRLVLSYVWDLPRVGGSRPLRRLLNGWSTAGIITLQSGFPVPITSSDDLEMMGSAGFTYPGRPDMIAPLRRLDPRNPSHLAFDPSALRQPDPGVIGNAPRSVCCGPGIANFDFSLSRNISLAESYNLRIRAEFFNIANHAQFTKVDGNISNGMPEDGGTFGRALVARNPRVIQLALKLVF